MLACELQEKNIFSIDGGETWLIVKAEPRYIDDGKLSIWVSPCGDASLSGSYNVELGWYDHVWEPDPEAVNRGDKYFPVKQ